jgi:Domain of unknown function (DUF5666)
MKINCKNIIQISTGVTFAAVLAVGAVACSSASSQTTSTVPLTTTSTTTTTPSSTETTQSSQFQRRGANGTIASINGNTLTLTTSQGQATVNISSTTTIEKTVTGSVIDLIQGDFVTVSGSPDSSGVVNATSIMLIQGQPPTVITPRTGGSTTRPNGSFPGGGTGGQMTIGTINSINGNSFTVTTAAQGQVTVNIGTNTTIQKTVSGTVSDLQTGVSITAIGQTDANGDVNATSISIGSPGQVFPVFQPTTTQSQTSTNNSNSATTYHIGVYSDANCTKPVSSLDWGNLPRGTSVTQTVYVKNADNQTAKVTASISAGTTSGVTFTNSGPINMSPGSLGPSVYQLQMSLSASSAAPLGDLNFSITLTGAIPVSLTSHVSIASPTAPTLTTTSP